jgi:hypothetical protein
VNENKEVITFLDELLKGKGIGVVLSRNPVSCPSAMRQGEILRQAQDDSPSPLQGERVPEGRRRVRGYLLIIAPPDRSLVDPGRSDAQWVNICRFWPSGSDFELSLAVLY